MTRSPTYSPEDDLTDVDIDRICEWLFENIPPHVRLHEQGEVMMVIIDAEAVARAFVDWLNMLNRMH
jgi:Zn-dependent M32 family carboxypeptidase